MKVFLRLFSTSFVLTASLLAVRVTASTSVEKRVLVEDSATAEDTGWVRPDWFPEGADVYALEQLDQAGPRKGPMVRASSAIVYDIDEGRVIFEKNADSVRPVASITKLVSALTLISTDPDLDGEVCIGREHYPTRNGARSHLSTGDCYTGWDLLGAALVASDNRAAFTLSSVAGMDIDGFVYRMNAVSAELGMSSSSWSDPSGLEDDNLSTARDIARATVAVATHPLLSGVASAPFWDLHRSDGAIRRRLFSTNRLSARQDLVFDAAKTGYTDTAGYCFTGAVQTMDGRRLVITVLGEQGKMTRWADMSRILDWVEGGESTVAESAPPRRGRRNRG